jgi:hypothetical protein
MASPEIEQLQEAMELGAYRERQRIIRLLEENLYHDDECNCDGCMIAGYVFALIKGEINE